MKFENLTKSERNAIIAGLEHIDYYDSQNPEFIQTFKIGLLCLWPFGSTVRETNSPTGCIRIPLNLLWLIFGGLWACLMHLFFGFLLCITIIGIPWGKQHFKMAGLSLAPFGKDVELGF